ncbi:MAG: hypothetical protein ACYSUI_07375 [Planctomycetota bacterium]|jgi:hypothetical protein
MARNETAAQARRRGKLAARTCQERYGRDYHRRLGLLGGNPVLLAVRQQKQEAAREAAERAADA